MSNCTWLTEILQVKNHDVELIIFAMSSVAKKRSFSENNCTSFLQVVSKLVAIFYFMAETLEIKKNLLENFES